MKAVASNRGVQLLVLLVFSGCADGTTNLDIPPVGTKYVLIAAAGGGRAVGELDVRVSLATEIKDLQIPGSGNIDVDMVFAGIDEADLPAGLAPTDLQFARNTKAGTRPVPPLTNAHILLAPSPPGTAGTLVPVRDAADTQPERTDRESRMDHLLRELAIVDPCIQPSAPFVVTTPRSRAAVIDAVRGLSNGDTFLGLTVTSTALLGRIRAGTTEFEEIGVDTGMTPIMATETSEIRDLGDGEVTDHEGLLRPAYVPVSRGDLLGHLAVWSATTSKYLDQTPRHLTDQPGNQIRMRKVRRGGTDMLCAFGNVVGMEGLRRGAAWCRPDGGTWSLAASIDGAVGFTAMIDAGALGTVLIDRRGAVHTEGGPNGWTEIAKPAVNQPARCDPVCVGFSAVSTAPPAQSPRLAIIAGRDANAIALDQAGNGVDLTPIERLQDALFADERRGPKAVDFSATYISPDGATWLAAEVDAVFILRVGADLSTAQRVCLPADADGAAVTAIGGTESGRMVLGLAPLGIAVGTWQLP